MPSKEKCLEKLLGNVVQLELKKRGQEQLHEFFSDFIAITGYPTIKDWYDGEKAIKKVFWCLEGLKTNRTNDAFVDMKLLEELGYLLLLQPEDGLGCIDMAKCLNYALGCHAMLEKSAVWQEAAEEDINDLTKMAMKVYARINFFKANSDFASAVLRAAYKTFLTLPTAANETKKVLSTPEKPN